jgi:hypothetical protein
MRRWWFPFLAALVSGAAGCLAAKHLATGWPFCGIFGCTLWALGASGAGLACARMNKTDLCLAFGGTVLIYAFFGQVAVPGTMLFGSQFLFDMASASAIAAAAFWLGATAGRFGLAREDPSGNTKPGSTWAWAAVAVLQAIPVLVVLVGLAFSLFTGMRFARRLPYLFWLEFFPLVAAIYAVTPWMWLMGARPARLHPLLRALGVIGIAGLLATAAFYSICVHPLVHRLR